MLYSYFFNMLKVGVPGATQVPQLLVYNRFLFCTPIGTIEILQKYEQNRLFQLRRTIMYKERLQHRSVMRRSLLKLILSLSANLQLLRR